MKKASENKWVKVKRNGIKQIKKPASNVKKNVIQCENTYEVLNKSPDKKSHLKLGKAGLSNKSTSNKSGSSPPVGNHLKCHKRNQRRNAKRRQKRLLVKKSKQFEDEVSNATMHFLDEDTTEGGIPLPKELWASKICPFLSVADLASFGACNKQGKAMANDNHHWKSRFESQFPTHNLSFVSDQDYKLAYKLHSNGSLQKHRCFHSRKTFFEDVLGLGVDFTVNPKTKKADYISIGQDLLSASAFKAGIKSDAFGNRFKLFLPLYFSKDHFERALPSIISTISSLCPEKPAYEFEPNMILDVLPKIINTFAVLISDEGVAASEKSFIGLIRIHRLFLALAKKYPSIETEAIRRIERFKAFCCKTTYPSLGNFLPLRLIVDEGTADWKTIRAKYISESLTRGVLWVCRAHPELERSEDKTPSCIDQRLELTREATKVGMRLNMLQVHFVSFLCQGSNTMRALRFDSFLEGAEVEGKVPNANGIASPQEALVNEGIGQDEGIEETHDIVTEPEEHGAHLSLSSKLSFSKFRFIVNDILTVKSWIRYFEFMRAPCPASKAKMAEILRNAVKTSARKKYHVPGMDFSRVHASGTSRILSKGQKFSTEGLQRVVFNDNWTFDGEVKYLDATCLVYKEKTLVKTIDYSQMMYGRNGVIRHSGDQIGDGTGSHTINLDLSRLSSDVTSCIFVLSAWSSATLLDITSASVSFRDADDANEDTTLCTYNLDKHDKISHLKSIIMCKLYRTSDAQWHVLAIGDSHKGSADNYRPIYTAAQRYL